MALNSGLILPLRLQIVIAPLTYIAERHQGSACIAINGLHQGLLNAAPDYPAKQGAPVHDADFTFGRESNGERKDCRLNLN